MANRKHVAAAVASSALIGALGLGGTLAYLTDAETATNAFTVGDVKIELLEPDYPGNDNPPSVDDLVPNEEVEKDPEVVNTSINDTAVFVTVDSPMENITEINDDGTLKEAKQVKEIFWFKDSADAASTHANHFNEQWTELTDKDMYIVIDKDGAERQIAEDSIATEYAKLPASSRLVRRHVFAYNTDIQGTTPNDDDGVRTSAKLGDARDEHTTTKLFDKVQLKNFIENEIDKTAQQIEVRAYAIQADKLLENDVDLGADLKTNAGKIYDIYVAQNSEGNDKSGLKVLKSNLRDADSVEKTKEGEVTRNESGSFDDPVVEHVNRWEQATDATKAGTNVKP